MAKKQRNAKFVIDEEEGTVRAALVVDGKLLLEFENEEAPPARIRSPMPTLEGLIESARHWFETEDRYETPAAQLDIYIATREKDLGKELLAIRKSVKRLEASLRCIALAKKAQRHLQEG